MSMRLDAVMSLNSGGFTNPLNQVGRSLGAMLGPLAALGGGVLSLAGIMGGMRKALTMGAELDHLGKRVGASAGQLAVLRQAFDDTGVGADNAGTLLNLMQRNLSAVDANGQSANRGVKMLGINLAAMADMGGVEKFNAIGEQIMRIADPAQRTAVAMDIFGRSGAQALQYFATGGAMDAAAKSLGSLPALLDRSSARFESIDTFMGRLKTKSTGLFAGVLEGFAGPLDGALAKLDAVDFTRWGVQIGDAFKQGFELFRSGKIMDVISTSLGIAYGESINYLVGPLSSIDLWQGVGQVILGSFMALGQGLLRIFMEPITYVQAAFDLLVDQLFAALAKIPKINKMLGLEHYGEAKTFDQHIADRRENGFYLKDAQRDSEGIVGQLTEAGLANIARGMATQTNDIMLTGDLRDQLTAIFADARDGVAAAAPALGAAVAQAAATIDEPLTLATGTKPAEALTDRLSKIGGFTGGGNPALTEAREQTRVLRRMLDRLNHMESEGGELVPVWG